MLLTEVPGPKSGRLARGRIACAPERDDQNLDRIAATAAAADQGKINAP